MRTQFEKWLRTETVISLRSHDVISLEIYSEITKKCHSHEIPWEKDTLGSISFLIFWEKKLFALEHHYLYLQAKQNLPKPSTQVLSLRKLLDICFFVKLIYQLTARFNVTHTQTLDKVLIGKSKIKNLGRSLLIYLDFLLNLNIYKFFKYLGQDLKLSYQINLRNSCIVYFLRFYKMKS